MFPYYLAYRAAIYRHRLLCRSLGLNPHSHDRFVRNVYWWWLP